MGGFLTKYNIQWFNALTGDLIFTETQTPNLSNELALKFPFLSGSEEQPIVFFQVFPEDESSFKSPETDSIPVLTNSFELQNPADSIVKDVEVTDWSGLQERPIEISLHPNPTNGKVQVNITGTISDDIYWQLSDSKGKTLIAGSSAQPNFILDLNVYNTGIYFVSLQIENQK